MLIAEGTQMADSCGGERGNGYTQEEGENHGAEGGVDVGGGVRR